MPRMGLFHGPTLIRDKRASEPAWELGRGSGILRLALAKLCDVPLVLLPSPPLSPSVSASSPFAEKGNLIWDCFLPLEGDSTVDAGDGGSSHCGL